MIALLIVVHIIVSVIMILIVLLQGGKGAEMGAAFGGASQTVFGSSGPTDFLGKLTTWSAGIFMATCLSLAYLSSGKSSPSVMDKAPVAVDQQAVEQPVAPEGIDQALPPLEMPEETSENPVPLEGADTVPTPDSEANE